MKLAYHQHESSNKLGRIFRFFRYAYMIYMYTKYISHSQSKIGSLVSSKWLSGWAAARPKKITSTRSIKLKPDDVPKENPWYPHSFWMTKTSTTIIKMYYIQIIVTSWHPLFFLGDVPPIPRKPFFSHMFHWILTFRSHEFPHGFSPSAALVQKIIRESRRFQEPNITRASPMKAMCTWELPEGSPWDSTKVNRNQQVRLTITITIVG